MENIKDKLLQFLLKHANGILARTGCPLEKNILDQLIQGENVTEIKDDVLDAFNSWYRTHALSVAAPITHESSTSTDDTASEFDNCDLDLDNKKTDKGQKLITGPPEPVDLVSASPDQALQLSPNLPQGASPSPITVSVNGVVKQIAPPTSFSSSPFSGSSPNRARLRTSFDQEHELPRLQKWFEQNQHPVREQMMCYVNELNSLPSRQGRRPLDLTNIIYWFKNARAANRRAILAGREGCVMNMSQFMDTSFNGHLSETGEESMSYNDEHFESDVTPRSSGDENDVTTENAKPVTSQQGDVPELPNRNAVYVVTPIHHSERSARDNVEFVNLQVDENSHSNDGPKDLSLSDRKRRVSVAEEEKVHNLSISSDKENTRYPSPTPPPSQENDIEEQACDLSLPKKKRTFSESENSFRSSHEKPSVENYEASNKLSRLMIKTERNVEDGYASSSSLSPSPRSSLNSSMGSQANPLASSQHLQHFQQFSQHAIQMAAMHALNMQFLGHPAAAALYGAHPAVVAPPPPPPSVLTPPTNHLPNLPLSLPSAFPTTQTSPMPKIGSPVSSINNSSLGNDASSPLSNSMSDDRKKRSRVFIDPLTEIPKLEKWFLEDTHPSSYMIEKYTDDLNMSSYRMRFPKLEPKNVQLWFKNHRAKVKRARLEQAALSQINNHVTQIKLEQSKQNDHVMPMNNHVTPTTSLPSTPSPTSTPATPIGSFINHMTQKNSISAIPSPITTAPSTPIVTT